MRRLLPTVSRRLVGISLFALVGVVLVVFVTFPILVRKKPNVILISIDTLRADHLGAYAYPKPTTPEIDRLAREGLLFENAFSTTSWTLPAHVALFSGMDDISHKVVDDDRRVPDGVPMLAQILGQAGYLTLGFFSGPYLDPGFGIARGFQEYYNCTSESPPAPGQVPENEALHASHSDVTNPVILRKVNERLNGEMRQPFFMFIHFWDVHYDYIPPEKYWRLFDPNYKGDFTATDFVFNTDFKPGMDPADFNHIVARYDGEIRYTDDTLRTILGEMQRKGLLKNTAVVIDADHGEEFLEHGGKGHRGHLFDEVLRIPLILWYPSHVAPGRSRKLVSITDVAPTILELVGIRKNPMMTGESLLRSSDQGRDLLIELKIAAFGMDQVGLRSLKQKVIDDRQLGRLDVYDLVADSAEKRPEVITDGAPPALAEMRRRLQAAEQSASARAAIVGESSMARAPEIDSGTAERLHVLGYR
jgi:arylsulfatase A-like enzyme